MLVLIAASEAVLTSVGSGGGRRKRAFVQISGGPRQKEQSRTMDRLPAHEAGRQGQKVRSASSGGGGGGPPPGQEVTRRRRRRSKRKRQQQQQEKEKEDEREAKVPATGRVDSNIVLGDEQHHLDRPSRAHSLPQCSPSSLFIQSVFDRVPARAQWRARQRKQLCLQQQRLSTSSSSLSSSSPSSCSSRPLLGCVAPDSCLHWPSVSTNDLFLEIFEAPMKTVAAMHAPPASLRAEVERHAAIGNAAQQVASG